jgi:hypothetical protein
MTTSFMTTYLTTTYLKTRFWRRTASVLGVIALASAALASAAFSQERVRVRGSVEKVEGDVVTVKSRDGKTLMLKLSDKSQVRGVVKASLSDIKDGTMVGVTSLPQPDGSLKATEVHIFPATQNVNQTHGPWDSQPNSFMTNGAVEQTVKGVDGQTLTVKYKTGDKVDEKKITVTPTTEIVTTVPGERSELKPGAKIFIANAGKLPDGMIDAQSISVGRDGMTPPM